MRICYNTHPKGIDMDITEFKIGPQIRAWRQKRNMIQKELAATVGMDVTQMWSIENDRNSPSLRTLARIAGALQISVQDLLRSPDDSNLSTTPSPQDPRSPHAFNVLHVGETDLLRIMHRKDHKDKVDENTLRKLEKLAAEAIALELRFHTLASTSLPFSLPFAKSEAGARQLALAVRAHCDVGSAIIHDSLALFESYGIRILEAPLPPHIDSITYYSPSHRNFTVFLSSRLKRKDMRSPRQHVFLSEIGRAFLFAANGFQIYPESDRRRRFVHHFAATFLLPELTVLTTVNSLRVSPDAWTWGLLERLSARFGVSTRMLNIRLKELNVISHKRYSEFDAQMQSLSTNRKQHTLSKTPLELSYRKGDLLALDENAN